MATSPPSTASDPPPYTISSTGFPPGYFIIRNIGTNKVLDIERDERYDGTEAILYPENESSHVLSFRDPSNDNQVFFVDYLGSLCCKSSGHGLDVEPDGRIVLRHRRPVLLPFPNHFSHPLPQFNYSAKTGQISVSFPYNPVNSGPNQASSAAWHNRTYLLTSIPIGKPRGLLDDATEFLQGAASLISTPFVSVLGIRNEADTNVSAADIQRGDYDLREEELSEVDRAATDDALDDSPDPLRRVRVISLPNNASMDIGPRTRERRQWEIIPLLKSKAMTGTM